MTKQVQRRRGSSSEHTSFTGAAGEISVNTTNNTMHVHDGSTAGGFESARSDLDNVSTSDITSGISGGTVATLTITSADINGGTLDNVTIGGSTAAAGTFTNITASGTINLNGATVSDGGTVTTVDIDGGTIDGVTIGGTTAGAGTFTNVTATGTINLNGATVSDGGTVTTVDIDGGSIDGATIGANSAAAGTFTTLTSTGDAVIGGDLTVNGTTTTINSTTVTVDDLNMVLASGAADAAAANGAGLTIDGASATFTYASTGDKWTMNKDLDVTGEVEADSLTVTGDLTVDTDTLFVDASADAVGIGTSSPSGGKLHVKGAAYDQQLVIERTDTSSKFGLSGGDSGSFQIYDENQSDATRFVIDSSGNVGIGTSSPASNQGFAKALEINDLGGTTGADLMLTNPTAGTDEFLGQISFNHADECLAAIPVKTDGATDSAHIQFQTQSTGGGLIERMRIDSSGNVLRYRSGTTDQYLHLTSVGGTQEIESVKNSLRLSVDPNNVDAGSLFMVDIDGSERMRIDSSGNVGIGTTNPTGNMAGVKGVAVEDTSAGYGFSSTSAGQKWLMWCNSGDEVEWYDVTGARPELQLTAAGALNNRTGNIGTISDERLKQDITPASSQWDDIKAVQVKNYRLIEDVEADGENAPTLLGVIAQELEASGMNGLVDEVTYTRPDENGDITTSTLKRKSVKQSILYMKAVKALQEAMERIETLEAKVTELENG